MNQNVGGVYGGSLKKQLLTFLVGAAVILVGLYLIVFFGVGLIVGMVPVKYEVKLGSMLSEVSNKEKINLTKKEQEQFQLAEETLDKLLDQLYQPGSKLEMPYPRTFFSLRVLNSPELNALAFPGGMIGIFKGTFGKLKSPDELSFILAHELGHFYGRHHLRMIGQQVVLGILAALFAGDFMIDLSGLVGKIFSINYSQTQELEADRFGAELTLGTFGHVQGAEQFFSRFQDSSKIVHMFATHPHSEKRLKKIQEFLQEQKKQNP